VKILIDSHLVLSKCQESENQTEFKLIRIASWFYFFLYFLELYQSYIQTKYRIFR